MPRYSTTRQKACEPCSTAKAKCDRKAGSCGRCALRGLACTYLQGSLSSRASHPTGDAKMCSTVSMTSSLAGSTPGASFVLEAASSTPTLTACPTGGFTPTSMRTMDVANNASASSTDATTRNEAVYGPHARRGPTELNFSHLDLVCPINADDIQNRWLNSFIPVPGQTVKTLPASITSFSYRIIKSYAAMAIRRRGIPPFIHPLQTLPTTLTPPLSTCLTLLRICDNPLPGSQSAAIEILQREMNRIHEHHTTYPDNLTLLAAFQAYLLYTLAFYFHFCSEDPNPSGFLHQAIMNLQEIACACSARGLVCAAETKGIRPRWEEWIVAEAKRRTLYTMYLFDNMLAAKDGLPTFLGTELRGLFAPGSTRLWKVEGREEWERECNLYLVDWSEEGGLRIEELWAVPDGMDEVGVERRRARVDRWLEGVDEFGTMVYAVTSCTHGG